MHVNTIRKKQGFTLVELIVTLAIVVVVTGVLGLLFATTINTFNRQNKLVSMDNYVAQLDRDLQGDIQYLYPTSTVNLCVVATSKAVVLNNVVKATGATTKVADVSSISGSSTMQIESITITALNTSSGVVNYTIAMRDANVTRSYKKSFTLFNKDKVKAYSGNCITG